MSDNIIKLAPLPLRLILGIGFVYHGFPKLFSAEGHQMFLGMLQGIGVPAPELTAWLIGVLELAGGVALIAGALVTVTSTLLIANMLVAVFTVHLANGFNFINIVGMSDGGPQFGMPGFEVPLLYIAGLAALAVKGPSFLSVDQLVAERAKRRSA